MYHADCCTVDSYRRAIERGCDDAFPPPGDLARRRIKGERRTRWELVAEWKARLGTEGWAGLEAWRASHRWHPHQLRHNAATFIRKEFGIESGAGHPGPPDGLGHRDLRRTR